MNRIKHVWRFFVMSSVIVMTLPSVAWAADYVGTNNVPAQSNYTNLPTTGLNITRMLVMALAVAAVGVAMVLQAKNAQRKAG